MDLLLADPDDGVVVVDYKTGFRRPTTPRTGDDPTRIAEAEADGKGLTELGWTQFQVYSYLCFKNIDWINRVVFREVTVLRQEERQGRMTIGQLEERVTDPLRAQVTMLHRAMQEGPDSEVWTPTAGSHCGMCPKPEACPIMSYKDLDLATEKGRRLVAEKWLVAKAVREDKEAILKGLVDAYGPIAVKGGKVAGWDMDKKNFGLYDPYDIPAAPGWDAEFERIGREAGVING
jgi:hypothetical protein